ncbi:10419_t:CDS:1, partial [Acaulospora colombiana]
MAYIGVYRHRSRGDLSHKWVEQTDARPADHLRDPPSIWKEHTMARATVYTARCSFHLSKIPDIHA